MLKRFLIGLCACLMLLACSVPALAQSRTITLDAHFMSSYTWDWKQAEWKTNELARAILPAVATLDILNSDTYGDMMIAIIQDAMAADNIFIAESAGLYFIYFYGDAYCLQLCFSPRDPSQLIASVMEGTNGIDQLPEMLLSAMNLFSVYYPVSAADYTTAVNSLLDALSGK